MATAFFDPAKQKAPVESSGSVLHVGLAGQSPLPIPGHAYLSAYGLKPWASMYSRFAAKSDCGSYARRSPSHFSAIIGAFPATKSAKATNVLRASLTG